MLHRTHNVLGYRAAFELDRIRGLLRGRARLERKLGLKKLFFMMRTQTRYRVEMQSYYNRSIVRKNVDSAAQEHGTSWVHLRNDLARQNLALMPRTQQMLAQYEPLAFRAVVELCASRIAPPPPPLLASVPREAYLPRAADGLTAHPAARRELYEGVTRMLSAGDSPALTAGGYTQPEQWMQAWREFDIGSRQSGQSCQPSGATAASAASKRAPATQLARSP